MSENRQPAGVPSGGQFATDPKTEPATTIPAPTAGRGFPDGEMRLRQFDIDGQFGPLIGYDDTRRWNGFPQPWLTEESLQDVKAATRGWAEVNAEVEWLDDAPDGVWRLHTGDGAPPVELEQAYNCGPHLETLHRLEGWCWDASEIGRTEHGEPVTWVDDGDPAGRPHPRKQVDVDGLLVRPTVTSSEYTLFVTDTDGAVYRVAGANSWDDTEVHGWVTAREDGVAPAGEVNARVRAAAIVAAPMLLPHLHGGAPAAGAAPGACICRSFYEGPVAGCPVHLGHP